MNSDYAIFFEFPQTPRENEWLKERMETLSAKESIILAAAQERHPPENVEDAINLLVSLRDYNIFSPAVSSM